MPKPNIYSQVLNLGQIDVYRNDIGNVDNYFTIDSLPTNLSYGKHAFSIGYTNPPGLPYLKNNSKVIFEFVDNRGTVIFSDIVDISDLSGAANAFIWIKKDPLRTADEILDGTAFLHIVGELGGEEIPQEWRGIYNLRTTFTNYEIRKDFPNTSPIVFANPIAIQTNTSFSESVDFDDNDSVFKRSYINVSASHMETNGGEVRFIELSYRELGAASNEFNTLSTYEISTGSFEVSGSVSEGLNPLSNEYKTPMPGDFRRDSTVQFKVRFLNPALEVAQHYTASLANTDVVITSSILNFGGSPLFIEGLDNLLTGSLYTGNVVGSGFEQSGQGSAYLRTVGYTGFVSASVGSGSSGILFFSGSILSGSGDDYKGVGFELHGGKGSSSFKFRSNPSLLEVKANTFFVGSETTQFISGSGNKIEISSSGFHLSPEGDITASRFLLEGGRILEDVTIEADLSANQIATPSGGPYKAVINAQGYAKFVSASIGGFYITDEKIRSGNDKVTLDQDGYAKFISASIGGFHIETDKIRSGNEKIILKSNGQISASSMLLTSGSFVVDPDNLSRFGGDGFASFFMADNTGIRMQTSNFNLNAQRFLISSSDVGVMAVGSNPPTAYDNGTGFYIDGDGKFLIGKSTGPRIQFDGFNTTISSSQFFLGSPAQFVSGAGGNIELRLLLVQLVDLQ